jgi:molecular chaperone HscB
MNAGVANQKVDTQALQPPPAMDHFALLGQQTPRFDLDLLALEQAYLAGQQAFHPDRWVGKSAAERARAAIHSANLNQAWTVLKDPLSRALYLCQLSGIALTSADGRFAEDPTLLTESLALREMLMEAETPAEIDAVRAQVAALWDRHLAQLAAAFANPAPDHATIRAATLRLQFLHKFRQELASPA